MIKLGNLEANLARACTMACAGCNHGSAIAEHWFMTPESMERDLSMLGRVAHFDLQCCQGGEPLTNKRILDFMDVQQRSGIADKYAILTNGTLLHVMPDEFWVKAARPNFELRMSVYPSFSRERLAELRKKAARFGVDFRAGEVNAFKPLFTKHTDGGARIWKICPWRTCYTCHEGYLYHCPLAAFFPGQFPELFDGPPPPLIDGYPLETLTEEALQAMLDRPHPLKSCEICTGAIIGDWTPWHDGRAMTKEQWIKDTTV